MTHRMSTIKPTKIPSAENDFSGNARCLVLLLGTMVFWTLPSSMWKGWCIGCYRTFYRRPCSFPFRYSFFFTGSIQFPSTMGHPGHHPSQKRPDRPEAWIHVGASPLWYSCYSIVIVSAYMFGCIQKLADTTQSVTFSMGKSMINHWVWVFLELSDKTNAPIVERSWKG